MRELPLMAAGAHGVAVRRGACSTTESAEVTEKQRTASVANASSMLSFLCVLGELRGAFKQFLDADARLNGAPIAFHPARSANADLVLRLRRASAPDGDASTASGAAERASEILPAPELDTRALRVAAIQTIAIGADRERAEARAHPARATASDIARRRGDDGSENRAGV